MSSDHHTPIATGAAANAATFNSVFEQLDAAITAGLGGITLTNQSGGSLAANDCVVVDTSNDEAVTTTTTGGDTTRPGVVVAGGVDGAEVTVSLLGEVTVVVDGAGTRGQWIKTSSTAKRVTPTSTLDVGVFGVLTSNSSGGAGTTATALVLGVIVTQPGSHTHAASEIVSGLLALARGGAGADLSATGPGFLKQASGGAAVTVAALAAGDIPSGIDAAKIGGGAVSSTVFGYLAGVTSALQTQLDGKASTSHKDSHKAGGSDALVVTDLLDAVARVQVKKSGTTNGTRRGINLIPGNNVSITVTDQSGDEHVDVEISAAGEGLGTDELTKVGASGTADYLNSSDFEQDASNHIRLNRATSIGVGLIGELRMWPTDSAPSGWLLCYGQAVSRTTYANLFTVIGTTFGVGDGSTTFNLPDFRGRMPLGQDDMGGASANRVTNAQADTIGGSAGAETHTLTVGEMPAHSHTTQNYVLPSGGGTLSGGGGYGNAGSGTNSAGSGGAHNNMPPYLAINFIIYAGG